jgi:prepilin-type N-terminal cleavage/methylation domain-containing protein
MDYQIKYKDDRGFSLVEILVVIGIFSILATISVSTYTNFKAHNSLEVTSNGLVEALRFAQLNSQAVNGDSKWGVKILENEMIIFKGSTYDSREISADQNIALVSGVVPSGLSEIIFEKVSGKTSTTGTIILTNNSGEKNILINEKGTITY